VRVLGFGHDKKGCEISCSYSWVEPIVNNGRHDSQPTFCSERMHNTSHNHSHSFTQSMDDPLLFILLFEHHKFRHALIMYTRSKCSPV